MSVAIFSPTPYINKWQMSLCNNSSDNKSYWIHRVDVKVSAQVTTVTYMHQSQPSLHSLRNNLTVHLELWPCNHLIWCNATICSFGLMRFNIIWHYLEVYWFDDTLVASEKLFYYTNDINMFMIWILWAKRTRCFGELVKYPVSLRPVLAAILGVLMNNISQIKKKC